MSVSHRRCWTAEPPPAPFHRPPSVVIWESPSAAELIASAGRFGYIIRGPYVLETPGDDRDRERDCETESTGSAPDMVAEWERPAP